jgi:hypothetical protein
VLGQSLAAANDVCELRSMLRRSSAAVAASREGQKALASRARGECRANTSGILLPFAVSFYRFEFMPIAAGAVHNNRT